MYAAALVMGDIFDAGYFDPEKQFALFLDINHLGFGEMGPSGVNASSSMTVKFHTKNMDHMVMLHSVYGEDAGGDGGLDGRSSHYSSGWWRGLRASIRTRS
jgi:hypothetical protein